MKKHFGRARREIEPWGLIALHHGSVLICSHDMIDESLLAKVSSLSPADRLELIRVMWETLSPDDLQMTDAERFLLDSRLADMEAHPDN